VLQDVADDYKSVWPLFIGVPGTMNFTNAMECLDLFAGMKNSVKFTINSHTYNHSFHLSNGIFPQWATIVKAISQPQG
jgi:Plant transposon protein